MLIQWYSQEKFKSIKKNDSSGIYYESFPSSTRILFMFQNVSTRYPRMDCTFWKLNTSESDR